MFFFSIKNYTFECRREEAGGKNQDQCKFKQNLLSSLSLTLLQTHDVMDSRVSALSLSQSRSRERTNFYVLKI